MEKMIREILNVVKSYDKKFDCIDKKFDLIDSKMDEQSRMLRALLDVNEIRKAQFDAHDIRLAKVEGTMKGQAKLAIEELSNV